MDANEFKKTPEGASDFCINNIHEKITRFWLAKSSAIQV